MFQLQTETIILNDIKRFLNELGFFVFRISQPRVFSRNIKGIADLFAIKQGLSLWIEIKTATGQQSASQIEFMDNIRSHGGKYLLIHSISELMIELQTLTVIK